MQLHSVWEYKQDALVQAFLSTAHASLQTGDRLIVERRDSVWRIELWVTE